MFKKRNIYLKNENTLAIKYKNTTTEVWGISEKRNSDFVDKVGVCFLKGGGGGAAKCKKVELHRKK